MKGAEILHLPNVGPVSDDEVSDVARVTKTLAVACVGLSLRYGWPTVLDSMLGAYYTLAMERMGPARLAEVLTDLADETLKRHVQ